MTDAEIDTFTARLHHFTRRGLADKLVTRNRESDDRRMCLGCLHLSGSERRGWDCRNWQRAGVAAKARGTQLSAALIEQTVGFSLKRLK